METRTDGERGIAICSEDDELRQREHDAVRVVDVEKCRSTDVVSRAGTCSRRTVRPGSNENHLVVCSTTSTALTDKLNSFFVSYPSTEPRTMEVRQFVFTTVLLFSF